MEKDQLRLADLGRGTPGGGGGGGADALLPLEIDPLFLYYQFLID